MKRRSDWLIGRWTAKHLIQSYIERQTGVQPLLHSLTVMNDPDGAPRVIADCRLQIADYDLDLQSAICNLQLSISHCDGHAFCALSDTDGMQIGVDIERIEPRAAEFAEDYFTAHELDQLRAAPPESRDTLVTLIWSAKEAALKALRLGLTVDTRKIECTVAPAIEIAPMGHSAERPPAGTQTCIPSPQGDGQPQAPGALWATRFQSPANLVWATLGVHAATDLLGEREYSFQAWWRRFDEYVLTMVVMGNASQCDSSVFNVETQDIASLH